MKIRIKAWSQCDVRALTASEVGRRIERVLLFRCHTFMFCDRWVPVSRSQSVKCADSALHSERSWDLGTSVSFENICNLMQPTLSWILNTSHYIIHSHKQAHNTRYLIINSNNVNLCSAFLGNWLSVRFKRTNQICEISHAAQACGQLCAVFYKGTKQMMTNKETLHSHH